MDAGRSGSWGLNVALRQPHCIQGLNRHPTPSGARLFLLAFTVGLKSLQTLPPRSTSCSRVCAWDSSV